MTFEAFSMYFAIVVVAFYLGCAVGSNRASRSTQTPVQPPAPSPEPPPAFAQLFAHLPPQPFDAPVAIGNRFTYLGLTILCTSHKVPTLLGSLVPGIRGEYIDRDGRICNAGFIGDDLIALSAEMRRAEQGAVT